MFTRKPVVLHIGMPKTGTTALQNLFVRWPDTRYAGKPGADPALRSVTDLDGKAWELGLDRTFRAAARLFAGEEERVLISEEELSVGSLTGGADPAAIARRLHLLFPRASVVVVLRSQLTLLPSLYGYAMTLPATPLVPFNAWMSDLRTVPPSGRRGLHLFDYAKLIGLYARLFGREQVHILLYEDLSADPSAFVARLARIVGVDEQERALLPDRRVNARPSMRTVRAIKLAERHPSAGRVLTALPPAARRRVAALATGGPPINTQFSADNEAFVRAYYGPGNRSLAESYGLPLVARGYPVR